MKSKHYLPSHCPYCQANVSKSKAPNGDRIYLCGSTANRETQIVKRNCQNGQMGLGI